MPGREKSLWLYPSRRPVEVRIERFCDYPYFFESFEQYGVRLPEIVTVTWRPLGRFLDVFVDEQDEAPDFIRWVMRVMKRGGDVPPLLAAVEKKRLRLIDGRHRAWAAWGIGLRRGPVVDISRHWLKMGTL
jgi:hypothetical protein